KLRHVHAGFAGQWELALLQDAALAGPPQRRLGRIAQLVEQLTLNQRVPGSSPGAPTNKINHLAGWQFFCATNCSSALHSSMSRAAMLLIARCTSPLCTAH